MNQFYTDEFGNRVLGFPPNRDSDDEEPGSACVRKPGRRGEWASLDLDASQCGAQRYMGNPRTACSCFA
jgi:hypothetical protein